MISLVLYGSDTLCLGLKEIRILQRTKTAIVRVMLNLIFVSEKKKKLHFMLSLN